MTLRLAGVYDLRTIKKLQESKVNHFAFDFRPRSLNFIQEHLCLKILKSSSFDYIYLQFENEKPYVVDRIYNLVRSNFEGKIFVEIFGQGFNFEDLTYPFIYNLNTSEIPVSVLENKHLKGYSIQADFLNDLKQRGGFEKWLSSFYRLNTRAANDLVHILCRDWDDDIFPSLFDLLDIELVSLTINPKVELCFRNVDLNKLSKQLQFIPHVRRSTISTSRGV